MKKITRIRILNATLILGAIVLGLSVIWTGDEENRFWQGKAIGGAITLIGVIIFLYGTAAVVTYKKSGSLKGIGAIWKEATLSFLSAGWKKKTNKKNKK